MKLTLLGTGNALVTKCYNTCFYLEEEGRFLLVDGGGGNQILSQLSRAGRSWRDMRHIFVTHKHLDHIMGIVWMLRMILQHMSEGSYEGEAFIYSHAEGIALLRQLAQMLLRPKETRFIDERLHLVTVEDGDTLSLIGHDVSFFDIGSTKAKQFGFCMELGGGEKLCCCGDEPFSERERAYAENSKWLMHEAFCLSGQADIFHPYEKHHSTVKDACTLAQQLNVKNLVLYHTEDANLERRAELYTREGSAYYSGNLFVPNDLDTIEL